MYDIYAYIHDHSTDIHSKELLWAPGFEDNGYILYSAILELKLNHSGKLQFQMSPRHPLYNKLNKRDTQIIVRRNGSTYWLGRVLDSRNDFYNRRTVVCEGALSYLLDQVHRPYSVSNARKSIENDLITILGAYNYKTTYEKSFMLGTITAVDKDTKITNKKEKPKTAYPTILDYLNDKYVGQYGGYLNVRFKEKSAFYDQQIILDYLSLSGIECNQKIRFGKNLLNLEDYITSENVCTRCVALGATLRDIDDFNKYTNSNYASTLAEDEGDVRITLLDHPDNKDSNVDYVRNEEAESLFGVVERSIVFEDVVTVESLKETAEEWLENNFAMNVSISIKALDLSILTDDVDAICCGSKVEIISDPHNIDMWMVCSALTLNILAPADSDYTFGSGFDCLSDQQALTLKRSSKAFDAAKSAGVVAKNLSSVIPDQYIRYTDFTEYKNELDKTIEEMETLPEPTNLDNGKVLKIINGAWVKANDDVGEAELPSTTADDNGKVLKVVDGQWTMADEDTVENELPEIAEGDNGKVLKIVDGQWVKADDVGEQELPAVTEEHEGMILKVVNGKWTAVAVE